MAVLLSIGGGTAPEAIDVHFKERGVMNEPIDGGERHCGIREDLAPFAEGLIGRDEQRASLIPSTDQLEQHGGLRLILTDVGNVVQLRYA